ncbi:hypothetical protein ACRJ4W_37545 [Streptomyces sp. GLT-R25]
MSNSAAYQWTYVDVEAERRRELRAQLAQETTRSRNLRGQAKSLRRAYRTARDRRGRRHRVGLRRLR